MVIIHDAKIANQFLQEFWARYQAAGGEVPKLRVAKGEDSTVVASRK